ncbi:MAG: hypothetical protein QOI64_1516 [Solirubrobacteraceae bacterium]|jgi:hypothetical protein|nr:hypothetical protein [Solirubrobacteraceae bacterium]
MKLRPPSPALAVSIVAVVVVCTGSAVAATVITGKQIRNGTISGVDIRNDTITSNKLSKGTQNILNSKRVPKPTGRIAYEAIRKAGPEGVPANVITRVATLTVPAGAYAVSANMVMTAFAGKTDPLEALLGANGSLGGTCTLDAGGPTHSSTGTIIVTNRQTPTTLSMQLTRTVGAPTDFTLNCSANAPWRASETSIIATSVDSVSLVEVTG